MDGRKTQSAKAVNRTPHDTGDSRRPKSAGIPRTPPSTGNWRRGVPVGDTRTPPEEEFGKKEIEKWLKNNLDCELKIENAPLFYSTTLDLSQDRPTPKLSDPSKPMRTLKEENVRDPLLTKLNLLADYTQSGRPYNPKLNIQLEYLLKQGKVGTRTFVCQSDVLVEVGSTTSCYKKTGPKIAVEKIGQTIYMYRYAFHSKGEVTDREEWQDKNEYVGLKFEDHMTQQCFDRDEKFWALVEAKLGDHELIISGEVDCVDEELGTLVELKTSKYDFEKLSFPVQLKWWLQCYLLGVKTIVVGKHDEDRKCAGAQKHAVDELKASVDVPQGNYKIFLATIHKFLTLVHEHMQNRATITNGARSILLFKRAQEDSVFTVEPSTDIEDDKFINDEIIGQLLAKGHSHPTATATDSAAPLLP